ncbi:type I DNA topoisomerase [Caloramator proteoclasticus]|uniref:DNA topoisomerase 1 n=1 Tax=Caloramator proteoclasticus DSM 10124 TaxID=1121262 RepID=A0A1M4SK80_9CLOT|nr:type I DNA topoisomerase [Caloramator proteoclasticus]SHE32601.1 DNA topoisomerase I [Caloramator proteoclasticus DSM 10124]
MAQSLVIVESPAKAKTIGKFLGKGYKIAASMGHVRDLPKSQLGVDIDNNYEPKYITIRGKGKLIDELKKEAKKCQKVYLATDPDREGEAISWHLATILGLNFNDECRIEFHEITKKALNEAIKNPRKINMNLVNAQQARRVLDRLVGYEISPILWKKVKWGLSAGRVQSVAVKLICEREQEINNFIPEEYWSITAKLKNKNKQFEAKFYGKANEKIELKNKEQVDEILNNLKDTEFKVVNVKKQEKKKSPMPPFTTSSLQQEAFKKLNFTTKKTMSIAQQLYEGIDIIGEGTVGLITYMRTDSVRVSEEAQREAKEYILNNFGKEYTSNTTKNYKTKGNVQDAHEAIRPTSVNRHPDNIKDSLTNDQYKLYNLIWNRFIASQMSEAVYDTTSVDITAGDYQFKATGSILKFNGYLSVYQQDEDEKEAKLPEININDVLSLINLDSKQHFTQPPARYTEATLVKVLEEKGIGRPSTYAPIISTILERGYVEKEKKYFIPTELGVIVTELLNENFKDIVDVEFTAEMEKKLDEIEEGQENWVEVVDSFFKPLKKQIELAENTIEKVSIEEKVEVTDIKCDKCGRNMVIKKSKYGKFLACPGYPECKNTKPILDELDVNCPLCGAKVVVRRSKKGKTFYGCSNYPKCNFVSWDKPTNEKCPKCGETLYEKNVKGEKKLVCINKNCK